MSIKRFVLVYTIGLLGIPAWSQLKLFEPPVDYTYANDFKVLVNSQESFVYENRVAAFTYFEMDSAVTVEVRFSGNIHEVDVRPKSLGILPKIEPGKIFITLDKPCNISVEINKNLKRPLFIFANPVLNDKPDKESPNVHYYEGGKVHRTGRVVLKDNDIVYIEGGAVVKGSFFLDEIKNVRIYGRGILDGDCVYEKGQERMIEINRCRNVSVEGIIINESKHWTVPCNLTENITYRNLKIVSGNDWDDGIDIVSSKNVLVDGCFIRTKDDCIAIKAGITYYTDFFNQYPSSDIQVINSVLWNAEWGNGLEIGFETRADSIKNIVFRNIDLIHVEGPEGTFTIHNGDRAIVENVLYEDIRVEDSRGLLVDFKILYSQYSKDKERGHINNIVFKNIDIQGEFIPPSLFLGFDSAHRVENVIFKKFSIRGIPVQNLDELQAKTEFAENLIFDSSKKITFRHISSANGQIDVPNNGNEQTSAVVADFNNDAINDFAISERTHAPALVWYQREKAGWKRMIVEDEFLPVEAGTTTCDVDGDGDMDIIAGGDYRSNQVWWWENPYPDFSASTGWKRYLIKSSGENKFHDQISGDFDGDGKTDIVFWSQGDRKLYFTRIPSDPKKLSSWKLIPVYSYYNDSQMEQTGRYPGFKGVNEHEGIAAADIDADGITDIIGGGMWFKYLANDNFSYSLIDASYTFSRASAGQLVRGGRPEVVLVVGDGWAPLNLYEFSNGTWNKKTILPEVSNGHSLAVIDFNADGNLDIWNAEMTLGDNDDAVNHLLLGDGKGNFPIEIVISKGIDLHDSEIVDLDGDGDLDILGKPYNGDAPRLDIWLQGE